MDREQLFQVFREIILTVTGVPEVILADQNAPSPNGEYAVVEPKMSVGERGQANVITTNGLDRDVNIDVRSQLSAQVTVNFYRGDSRTRAEKLKQCNKRPDIQALLFTNKVGWAATTAVRNLTALQSDDRESRAQIEITAWFEDSDVVNVNCIEKVPLTVEDEMDSVLYDGVIDTTDI